MAALGVHDHDIERECPAFPFEPRAFWPPCHVRCIGALQHYSFDAARAGSVAANLVRAMNVKKRGAAAPLLIGAALAACLAAPAQADEMLATTIDKPIRRMALLIVFPVQGMPPFYTRSDEPK